jgi:hypothetical protein
MFPCRRFSQCAIISISPMLARTPPASMNRPKMIAMIVCAVSPVSDTVLPQPSHTGACTVIGRPRAVPGQLAAMRCGRPWTRMPLVNVEQPPRPQLWPYDVGRNVAVGPAPAR